MQLPTSAVARFTVASITSPRDQGPIESVLSPLGASSSRPYQERFAICNMTFATKYHGRGH